MFNDTSLAEMYTSFTNQTEIVQCLLWLGWKLRLNENSL